MSNSLKCNVKGIILAGGSGSRLLPLTKITNKHLLPVGNKPMIYHSIEKLTKAGINEICIVSGVNHLGDMVQLLGSGADFNCQFTYKVQDQAGGIAEALGLARNFARGDRMVVVLGDNIFEADITPFVDAFRKQEKGGRVLLTEVPDPKRYGVAVMEGEKILKIEEKPEEPKSNFAVTGIYFYDQQVFDFVDQCEYSARGELEITDVNNFYIESGQCFYDVLPGWWTDAGTLPSLQYANELCLK